MEIIYLLILITLVLVGVIIYWFFWAVGSGQFEDLQREGHRILMDDDGVNVRDRVPESPGDEHADDDPSPTG